MEIRELKSSDMGQLCKILSSIGIKEFKKAFEGVDIKNKTTEQVGYLVFFEIAGIVINNIPKAQKDIDSFLASLTNKNIEDIQEMSLTKYGELIIEVVTKDDFKDFFNLVMKLFNP